MATTRSQSASNFRMILALVVLALVGVGAYFFLSATPLAMTPQVGKSHQADPDDPTCPKPNL